MKQIFGVSSVCAAALLFVAGCKDSTSPKDPNAGSPNLGTLSVGGSRVLTASQAASGLTIPENLASAEFLVVVSNVGPENGTAVTYTIQGNRIVASEPKADVLTPSAFPKLSLRSGPITRQSLFEGQLRARERAYLKFPSAGDRRLTPRFQRTVNALQIGQNVQVGDQVNIKVTGDGRCNGPSANTVGTVKYVSTHAVIVVDNAAAGAPYAFSNADYQAIGTRFDQTIYPTDVKYFGTPSDIDNNKRIVMYYTPQVNALTSDPDDGVIAGFFFSGDLFPATGSGACAVSNEGEIFYLLAPAPLYSQTYVRETTESTIAHEFQHMINAGHRLFVSNASAFESVWLDEALAHFAEDAVGRTMIGLQDMGKFTAQHYNALDDEEWGFFFQNLARTKMFIKAMDTYSPLGNDDDAAATLETRGAAWALLRYAADWYSGSNPAALTKKLVTQRDTGVVNFAKVLNAPMDSVLSRWLITLYADARPGTPDRFHYRSYDFRNLITALPLGTQHPAGQYGLVPTSIGSGSNNLSRSFPRGSGAYFLVNQGSGARTITVTPTSDTNGRIYILRTK